MKKCVVWIFGRGASVACGLSWEEPDEWKMKDRENRISKIENTLRSEMDRADTTVYRQLLSDLAARTSQHWHHSFVTTNWDFLLQREIERLSLVKLPAWLRNSHVFHLNGTVEKLKDNSNRSHFLLETDTPEYRGKTIEGQVAFNHLIWQQIFVVVGLSFRYGIDRTLLEAFNKIHDECPVGESDWIIVNPNDSDLRDAARYVQKDLPCSCICMLHMKFDDWLKHGMPQLQKKGILVA